MLAQEHNQLPPLDEVQIAQLLNGMPSSTRSKFLAERLFPYVQVACHSASYLVQRVVRHIV